MSIVQTFGICGCTALSALSLVVHSEQSMRLLAQARGDTHRLEVLSSARSTAMLRVPKGDCETPWTTATLMVKGLKASQEAEGGVRVWLSASPGELGPGSAIVAGEINFFALKSGRPLDVSYVIEPDRLKTILASTPSCSLSVHLVPVSTATFGSLSYESIELWGH